MKAQVLNFIPKISQCGRKMVATEIHAGTVAGIESECGRSPRGEQAARGRAVLSAAIGLEKGKHS
ncbi:MAG: hypothetical protein SFY69_05445 [Planctomycetota bacterium]|nr:hypothetical protein [Planctomycetota bacterium]